MTDYAELEKRLRQEARDTENHYTTRELAAEAADAVAALARQLEEARAVLQFVADDAPTHYGSCVTMKQAEIADRWILTAKHARDYVTDGTLPRLMRLSTAPSDKDSEG